MIAFRMPLTRALVFAALSLMAFFATRLVTSAIAMQYGDVPFLPLVSSASLWAALAALGGALIAAAMVTLPSALERAPMRRRLAVALPALLVCLVALGLKLHFFEIGTIGRLIEVPFLGRLTLTQTWLALFGVLATVALPAAARRAPVPLGGQRATLRVLRLAAVALGAAWLGMVLLLGQVAAAPPPEQGPPGGGGAAGDEPALVVMLLVGTVLTALFALGMLANTARAGRAGVSGGAKAIAPVGAAGGGWDVPGMLGAWLATALIALAASQLVPVTRDNPPVVTATAWDAPETSELWGRTCAACHSNETEWPGYASIAPSSWLVAGHVKAGRRALNVSQIDELSENRRTRLPDQLERAISSGRMPPKDFLLLHPEARLTAAEQDALIQGLKATFPAPAPAP